jgi:hypothetical protein
MLFMVIPLLVEVLAAEVTCGPFGVTGYVKTSRYSNRRAEGKFPEFEDST